MAKSKRNRMSRAEKVVATRQKLFGAAAQVVGAEGYSDASIAKITARAHVAQGTFYNYFESRQELFEQLLPELGKQLLDFIRSRITDCQDGMAREEIGFRAFFEFLARTPEFYRILNEAETFSPKAFRDHMGNMIRGYLRALQRAQEQGGVSGYTPEELEVIVCILLGARNYISYRYMFSNGNIQQVPDRIARAYMKFVAAGMLCGGTSGSTFRPRRSKQSTKAAIGPSGPEIVSQKPGEAVLQLAVEAAHRDPAGMVRAAALLDLVSQAAEKVANPVDKSTAALLNLSVSALNATRSRQLLAFVRSEQRSGNIIHVSIEVQEGGNEGRLIMSGHATFALHVPRRRTPAARSS